MVLQSFVCYVYFLLLCWETFFIPRWGPNNSLFSGTLGDSLHFQALLSWGLSDVYLHSKFCHSAVWGSWREAEFRRSRTLLLRFSTHLGTLASRPSSVYLVNTSPCPLLFVPKVVTSSSSHRTSIHVNSIEVTGVGTVTLSSPRMFFSLSLGTATLVTIVLEKNPHFHRNSVWLSHVCFLPAGHVPQKWILPPPTHCPHPQISALSVKNLSHRCQSKCTKKANNSRNYK